MKKISIFALALTLSLTTIAQDFMGISVDGSKSIIRSKFLAKQFTEKKISSPSALLFNGHVSGTPIEVYVFFSPKSNIAWKFVVYLPKQSDWYALKNEYNKYLDLLTEKYGKPSSLYSTFLSPYYEGDGYEISAVGIDKCLFSAFWNASYSLEISKYKQVKITYENTKNSEISAKETNQIDNANF
jgi:hypothetical protein